MFYTFSSQEERRDFGGSGFIEFQFCKMPSGTRIHEIVLVESIRHWRDDSLYVADESAFYEEYSHIFDNGTYADLGHGTVDLYGINYYAPDAIDGIMRKILLHVPVDHRKLVEWLERAKAYNGFYILGI